MTGHRCMTAESTLYLFIQYMATRELMRDLFLAEIIMRDSIIYRTYRGRNPDETEYTRTSNFLYANGRKMRCSRLIRIWPYIYFCSFADVKKNIPRVCTYTCLLRTYGRITHTHAMNTVRGARVLPLILRGFPCKESPYAFRAAQQLRKKNVTSLKMKNLSAVWATVSRRYRTLL